MIELLSPAGDRERLEIACLYGADAIYLAGKNFGLRANATNFTNEELKSSIEYAHNLGKKVYVTVNIVFHNEDLDGLKEYLEFLNSIKTDAIIVSDPVVFEILREHSIDLEVHISTQASTLNEKAALFYKEQGAKRIVLAREADKDEIERIKKTTNLDVECFIQGAMCTSMSGRCVLSNYATNRDSNRGGCAQVCRWSFKDEDNHEFEMMPKDLNMIENIDSMIKIGVNSFKIEGRMRSIYYIATVIHTYKRLIEKSLNKTLNEEYIEYAKNIINRVANRESVSQFYKEIPRDSEQYWNGRMEESNQDFLGLVHGSDDLIATVEVRNYFKVGDVVQIFGPTMKTIEFTINKIFSLEGNELTVCNHPKDIVLMPVPENCEKMSMMRLKVFDICDDF